ncbi:MAG: DUF1579 family protein, partial [Acidobacteria bacterium]|nr:DUF1579 family protein [Acidobacteriota bacterium]
HADAHPQHQWLHQLVGPWTYTMLSGHGITPGEAAGSGTEVVRSIGGLWVVADGQATMPGMGPYTTVAILGFNPATGRFVGTYIASFMTHLWLYDGALDDAGRRLNLGSDGPSAFATGRQPSGSPWPGPVLVWSRRTSPAATSAVAGQVRRLRLEP